MKRNLTVFFSCLMVILAFTAGQAMAVDVYSEGAYSDTDNDVQVCIYADIDGSEALRSFGVKLVYNPGELTFDATKSTKNEAVWYLGDGTNNEAYRDPEDVEDGLDRAVVIIGGKLDTNTGMAGVKVSGDRVLLGTVWFTRDSGSGPLANPLTLAIGKVTPYANFVKGPEEGDVLDEAITFDHPDFDVFPDDGAVVVKQRGDANADNMVTNVDMGTVRNMILSGGDYKCFADANADGMITNVDMGVIRNIILGL